MDIIQNLDFRLMIKKTLLHFTLGKLVDKLIS